MRSPNLLRLCAALALGLIPAAAHAVPGFPREIKSDLSLDYEPPCFICHVKNNTGSGTANTPFALGLRERALDAEARTSLAAALTKLDSDDVDSDGDKVSDVDELRAGTDPNSEATASIRNQAEPEWGCSVVAPHAHAPLGLGGLALALAGLFVLRRRPRR
jgi:hypothetical protein